MDLEEHVVQTGLDHQEQSNRKLQPAKLTVMRTADEHINKDNEDASSVSNRAGNEKIKQRKSNVALVSEGMQIYRTDQPENKEVFLPRLTGSPERASPDKCRDEKCQQLRLPEIRIVPTNHSMLALNRSITDLLDPEMEILNKIKYGPRKKRKKRRNKTVDHCESTLP